MKHRVGLLSGESGAAAVATHVHLMESHCSLVPIRVAESADERDWIGRTTPWEDNGTPGWTVQAALMRADRLGVRGQVPNRDVYWQSQADALCALARRERLAALHVHGWSTDAPAAVLAAALADLPLILTFQGSDLDSGLFTATAQMHSAVAAASACACRSEPQANLLRRVFAPPCPLHVVPHHVPPAPEATGPPPVLDLPSPMIGCVGRLERGMGVDVLLEAFDALADHRACSLLLAGPVALSDAAWMAERLAATRHGERIACAGHVARRRLHLFRQACDLLVVPCVGEGFEMELLEAMRDGGAVVTSNLPALAEMGMGGVEGWSVPSRDSAALAAAMAHLLAHPREREERAQGIRRDVLARFRPERERESWLDCYRSAGLEM